MGGSAGVLGQGLTFSPTSVGPDVPSLCCGCFGQLSPSTSGTHRPVPANKTALASNLGYSPFQTPDFPFSKIVPERGLSQDPVCSYLPCCCPSISWPPAHTAGVHLYACGRGGESTVCVTGSWGFICWENGSLMLWECQGFSSRSYWDLDLPGTIPPICALPGSSQPGETQGPSAAPRQGSCCSSTAEPTVPQDPLSGRVSPPGVPSCHQKLPKNSRQI